MTDSFGNMNRTVVFRSRNTKNSQSNNNNRVNANKVNEEPKLYIDRLNKLINHAQMHQKQIFSDHALKAINMWHDKQTRNMILGCIMYLEFFPTNENNHKAFNTDYLNISTINIGTNNNMNVVNAIPMRNLLDDWIKSVACYMKHNYPAFTSIGELFSKLITIRTKKNQLQLIFGANSLGFNWSTLVDAMEKFVFHWNISMACGSAPRWVEYNTKMVSMGQTKNHVLVFMMDILIYKMLKNKEYYKFALLTDMPFINNKKAYETRLQIRMVLSQILGVDSINDVTVMKLGTWSTRTVGMSSKPFYSVLPGYTVYLKYPLDLVQFRGLIENNLRHVLSAYVIQHDDFENLWRSIQSSDGTTGNVLVPIQKYQVLFNYVRTNHYQFVKGGVNVNVNQTIDVNLKVKNTAIGTWTGTGAINLDDLDYPQ